MSKPSTSTPKGANGVFFQTLAAMNNGQVLEDLDDSIREVVRSVQASQTKGKVTIELTISPNGVGVGDVPLYKVQDKIKVSLPKAPRPASSFFCDEDNNLTRRNPKQGDIEFTTLEGDKPAAAPALAQGTPKASAS